MTGMLTVEEIENAIRRGEIDTVITAFPDHLGRLVGKRVAGDYFLDHVLTRPLHACAYLLTVDMEMNPLPGFELTSWGKGYGDFRMIPDLSTLRTAAWLEKTAIVLCDLESEEGGEPIPEAPRSILREQVALGLENGYALAMGSELEFYLFDDDYRSARARAYRDLRPSSDYIIDYHILACTSDEPVIREIRNRLNSSGIPIEFSKGEWGNGQHEINLRYADPVEMADRHVIYKNAVREIAASMGKSVSFMAKYSAAAAGSSCHFHTSLTDSSTGRNLFWDEIRHGPSQEFRWFIGGLLRAERELCLLFAPTVNSYKRFKRGTFAPTGVAWGLDNRTCCLRCVGHAASFRIENRLPGADVNPYVAMAATIGAGLWGIENKVDCGDAFKGDAYLSPRVKRVPRTLKEAIDLFEKSSIAKAIISERARKSLLRHAQLEQEAFEDSVTDWEMFRYFERI
jgi:glutamine synthetase